MKLLATAIISLILTGCSFEASLLDLNASRKNYGTATGLSSGSMHDAKAISTQGKVYNVQSSLGSYLSEMEQSSTNGKYRVYNSMQGVLISN